MKNKEIQVVPAIIPEDFYELSEDIERVKKYVSTIQIDIFDGSLAPTYTWPYIEESPEFSSLVNGSLPMPGWEDVFFEIDLAVERPERVIQDWIDMGANSIIIHSESTKEIDSIREQLTKFDVKMGIAFRPSDEVKNIDKADFIQFMGNDKIGYHGVELDPKVYDRVKEVRDIYPEIDIAVDIGVNKKTAYKLKMVGVNKLVSGSFIFDSIDVEDAIQFLSKL